MTDSFQVPDFIKPFEEGKTAGECYRALFQYLFDLGRTSPTAEQKNVVFDAGMELIATITKDYTMHAMMAMVGFRAESALGEAAHD